MNENVSAETSDDVIDQPMPELFEERAERYRQSFEKYARTSLIRGAGPSTEQSAKNIINQLADEGHIGAYGSFFELYRRYFEAHLYSPSIEVSRQTLSTTSAPVLSIAYRPELSHIGLKATTLTSLVFHEVYENYGDIAHQLKANDGTFKTSVSDALCAEFDRILAADIGQYNTFQMGTAGLCLLTIFKDRVREYAASGSVVSLGFSPPAPDPARGDIITSRSAILRTFCADEARFIFIKLSIEINNICFDKIPVLN